MLLDAAHTVLELADQDAVADHGGMVFGEGLPQRGLTIVQVVHAAGEILYVLAIVKPLTRRRSAPACGAR